MNRVETQQAKANAFRALHRGGNILLLPNAWDVASALILEECGFPAVATTSAGIAFSLGYPDGQQISPDEMLARIERIARAVKVPVTADIEAGYGDTPREAARIARRVIDAGAVGLNLEDAIHGVTDGGNPLCDVSLQVEKIHAIREAAMKAAVLLVVNARTDVYLLQVGPADSRYDAAVRRLIAFRDAGADCVFLPGLRDAATIGRLVKDVSCPVNILAGPGSPSVSQLQAMGVARVSLGSGPMRATLGLLRRLSEELRTSGGYSALEAAPSHEELNRVMSASRQKVT